MRLCSILTMLVFLGCGGGHLPEPKVEPEEEFPELEWDEIEPEEPMEVPTLEPVDFPNISRNLEDFARITPWDTPETKPEISLLLRRMPPVHQIEGTLEVSHRDLFEIKGTLGLFYGIRWVEPSQLRLRLDPGVHAEWKQRRHQGKLSPLPQPPYAPALDSETKTDFGWLPPATIFSNKSQDPRMLLYLAFLALLLGVRWLYMR